MMLYANGIGFFLVVVALLLFVGLSSAMDPEEDQDTMMTMADIADSQMFRDLVQLKSEEVINGEIGDRCDVGDQHPKCREGLSCVGIPLFRTCQPIDCNDLAVRKVFVEQFNMEDYTAMILREAGLEGRDDFWEDNDGWFGSFRGKRIKPEVERALVSTMMDHPIPLDDFQREIKNSCGDSIKAPRQATVDGTTTYGGLILKASLVLRLSNAYFFAQGEADRGGAWYTDICTGLGIEKGIKIAGIVGTVFSGTRVDLEGSTLGFSLDLTPFLGYSIWVGFGVPNGVARVNNEIGVGFLLGIGFVFCQTILLTDFTPPSPSPTTAPVTAAPTTATITARSPTTSPSKCPSSGPSQSPSGAPSGIPSGSPSGAPSQPPSVAPVVVAARDHQTRK